MYLWQTLATPHGHVVTAEEWNNYWNLMMTQGDHTSKAVTDMRDMLYETVLSETNGAAAIKFTGAGFTATDVSAALLEISTKYDAELDLKAPINNPTLTGTVGGVTKAMVGLGVVDNTSDVNKPVSSAQQTALNLKANLAALVAHQSSGDHDGRYAFLANMTPFTPTQPHHLVTKVYQETKIAEAVLGGIPDGTITDQKMAVGNKKADIVVDAVAAVLPLIPPSPFDFDTPVGKVGWAYAISGTGPVTEQYLDGATVKCSRVTTFNAPSAGKTTVAVTAPTGTVTTQVFNADGSADPITEV